jgi:Mg/Co/Ni transporter MgtE
MSSPTSSGTVNINLDNVVGNSSESDTSLSNFNHRAGWLVILLAFQSCSSFILQHFDVLIRKHPVVVFFLTMLVGAGGNVGGQSTLLVVRRLALLSPGNALSKDADNQASKAVCHELSVGCKLAMVLLLASAVRCEAFAVRGMECLAICLSMCAIVITSAVLGAALPFLFKRCDIDPAHAGAAIQVAMDCIGVTLTCIVSCLVLGLPLSDSGIPGADHSQPPEHMRNAIQREGTLHGLNMFGDIIPQ